VSLDTAENAQTTSVREAHRFNEGRLAEWMTAYIDGYRGPLSVSQFTGGQSNPTYKLITPTKTYVLRRKPSGELLKGAHAIEREVRVLRALRSLDFPVPQVYGLCTDDTIIGTWFYVMEMVDGRVVWDATFPLVSGADRPHYFDGMNASLARLHWLTMTPSACPPMVARVATRASDQALVHSVSGGHRRRPKPKYGPANRMAPGQHPAR
jgi:aminoglycoside phosphotransferase (APT) family kinase protein